QGGNNYKFEYSHDWDNLGLDVYAFKHESELSQFAASNDPFNSVAFHNGRDDATNTDISRGGTGSNLITNRDSKEFGASLDYLLSTNWGEHTFKAGFLKGEGTYEEQTLYPAGPRYTSISAGDAGTTMAQYMGIGGYAWRGPLAISSTDIARLMAATGLTQAQLLAKTFTDTTGNPYNQVNVYRILQSENEGLAYTVKSKQTSAYLQD